MMDYEESIELINNPHFTESEIKKLREVTGHGMMDCKKALIKSDGDFNEAIKILETMSKILIHKVNE